MTSIVVGLIREMITIEEMHFASVPGKGTTDAIFIILQLQAKFFPMQDLNGTNPTIHFTFVNLEKASD